MRFAFWFRVRVLFEGYPSQDHEVMTTGRVEAIKHVLDVCLHAPAVRRISVEMLRDATTEEAADLFAHLDGVQQ